MLTCRTYLDTSAVNRCLLLPWTLSAACKCVHESTFSAPKWSVPLDISTPKGDAPKVSEHRLNFSPHSCGRGYCYPFGDRNFWWSLLCPWCLLVGSWGYKGMKNTVAFYAFLGFLRMSYHNSASLHMHSNEPRKGVERLCSVRVNALSPWPVRCIAKSIGRTWTKNKIPIITSKAGSSSNAYFG